MNVTVLGSKCCGTYLTFNRNSSALRADKNATSAAHPRTCVTKYLGSALPISYEYLMKIISPTYRTDLPYLLNNHNHSFTHTTTTYACPRAVPVDAFNQAVISWQKSVV